MIVRIALIGISIYEIGLLYWLLCGTVLEKSFFRKKEWGIIIVNTVGLGILLGINRSMGFFSHYMFAMSVTITCIFVIVIKGQNKLLKIIIVVLYYTVVTLLDFFFAFVSMMILKEEFDERVFSYANSWVECILFICSRIIIAVCINLIVKQGCERIYFNGFQGVLLLITIIMYLMLRGYQIEIVKIIYENKEQEAGVGAVSLVVILLIIFFIGLLYLKNKTLEKEKEFLAMREDMVKKKYIELENVMEKHRHIIHDLKNHLIVLKNYEEEGNYKGIHNYIEEMGKEFFDVKIHVWTGNHIADMLMEQKKALAEQEGIMFMLQAMPIAEWPFNDSETCSLLGNLLDNAIEACKRIDNYADRWICIKIENQKQLLFIRIRNSIGERPIMKNGKPVTAKHDKKKHGYGLKSVERIVNKYDGMIIYQIKENIFQVNISV